MIELGVATTSRRELIDITDAMTDAVRDQPGIWHAFVPHTTAGITINEGADPDVARDLLLAWEDIVDEHLSYAHTEGNSPAHVMASLAGASVVVRFDGDRFSLGTWQSIFFCEFDGPRRRRVWLDRLSS